MTTEQDRFQKILTLAIDPSAYEGEAAAALNKVAEMTQRTCHNWKKAHDRFKLTGAERDGRAAFAAGLEFRTMFDKYEEARRAFFNRR
jgi:hypothetical protein